MIQQIWDSFVNQFLAPTIVGVVTVFGMWLREKVLKKAKSLSLRVNFNRTEHIKDILTEARIKFAAQRAYLSLFHNGSKYIEGSEIIKYSRMVESVQEGISFQANNNQEVLVTLVPDEMKLVEEPGASYTITSSLQDGKLKRMLFAIGVKAINRCPVRKGNDIIGFVGLDYTHSDKPPENVEELMNYAGVIQQVLESYRS